MNELSFCQVERERRGQQGTGAQIVQRDLCICVSFPERKVLVRGKRK